MKNNGIQKEQFLKKMKRVKWYFALPVILLCITLISPSVYMADEASQTETETSEWNTEDPEPSSEEQKEEETGEAVSEDSDTEELPAENIEEEPSDETSETRSEQDEPQSAQDALSEEETTQDAENEEPSGEQELLTPEEETVCEGPVIIEEETVSEETPVEPETEASEPDPTEQPVPEDITDNGEAPEEEEGSGNEEETDLNSEETESQETETSDNPADEAVSESEEEETSSDVINSEETETLENLFDNADEQTVLSFGMTGDAVLKMQQKLQALGYLTAVPDGIFGKYSLAALKKFQMYNGLELTGITDEPTRSKLQDESAEAFRVLWKGQWSKAVYYLQQQLYDLGFLPVDPDGGFGNYTEAALKAYQAAEGLEYPDGGFGNWTFSHLIDTPVSFSSMQKGSTGIAVKALQHKLYSSGFLAANPDGIFGNYTEKAIRKFQLYHNLEVNGTADCKTVNAIYRSGQKLTSLEKGNWGNAVMGLQKALKELGYLKVEPDGGFGEYTRQAVSDFQRANGLEADGILGSETLEALLSDPVTAEEKAENTSVVYGGTYIINTGLGIRVLDVSNASVYAGANVQLYTRNDTGAQMWVLQSAGGSAYYFRNLRSWKCLDVSGGNVQQSEANGAASQKWSLKKHDGGGYYIVNANGEYLNVSSGTDTDGDDVNVAAKGESAAQVWYFTEVSPGTALNFKVDGTQYIGIRSFSIFSGNVSQTTGYYDINTNIALPSGGYYLSGGSNYSIGLKVMYVNSYLASAGYLSWDYYNYNRYDGNTTWAVQQFQADHGLIVDGSVGINTWLAMGYSEYDFYHLGSYTTPLKVYAYGSSRSTYVQAMLNTAAEYANAGTAFADGASGQPGTYVDCSGLIYQCLYAAGINPDTNIIDHARVVYEYTSNYLGNDWKLGTSVSYAEPGDLIFYGSSSINHVAIYVGGGMIYDSWPGLGVTYRSMYSPGNIIKIVRVF